MQRWCEQNKGSPISKAPVKRAQHIVPSVFCKRGEVTDDVVSPCPAGRVTSSHPGCLRQRCQLHAEPHQSPIRIKAWERSPTETHAGPWHLVPQTTVGTRLCPPHASTGCLAASGRQPPHGSQPRRSVPTPVAREIAGWRLRLIGSAGSRPNPFASSQLHPSSAEPSRRHETHRTAPARATCDNRRVPAYVPPPSVPPGDASVPACADRNSGSRPHSEWRSAPPR